jgi:hypothetical protein
VTKRPTRDPEIAPTPPFRFENKVRSCSLRKEAGRFSLGLIE